MNLTSPLTKMDYRNSVGPTNVLVQRTFNKKFLGSGNTVMNIFIVGTNTSSIDIKVNDMVLIKPDVYVNGDGLNEYCLEAYVMQEGIETEMLGYVGREFLAFKGLLEYKLGQITKVLNCSTNRKEKQESIECNGVCICKIVN